MTLPPGMRDEQVIDGVRMYIKDDAEGTPVIADKWDMYFNPPKGKVKTFRYKGENPDKTRNWIKGIKSY